MGTFSIWHWIIVLVVIVAWVLGAWTAWSRHLTYKQYLIAYGTVFVAGLITEFISSTPSEGAWRAILIPVALLLISFTGVHITVRRLHTIGWKRWMGVVPVLNSVVSLVMLFNPKPDPQK